LKYRKKPKWKKKRKRKKILELLTKEKVKKDKKKEQKIRKEAHTCASLLLLEWLESVTEKWNSTKHEIPRV
jgi:hypothetical protein